jgi:hypothetical protein
MIITIIPHHHHYHHLLLSQVLFTIFSDALNGTQYTAGSVVLFLFNAAVGSVLFGKKRELMMMIKMMMIAMMTMMMMMIFPFQAS